VALIRMVRKAERPCEVSHGLRTQVGGRGVCRAHLELKVGLPHNLALSDSSLSGILVPVKGTGVASNMVAVFSGTRDIIRFIAGFTLACLICRLIEPERTASLIASISARPGWRRYCRPCHQGRCISMEESLFDSGGDVRNP